MDLGRPGVLNALRKPLEHQGIDPDPPGAFFIFGEKSGINGEKSGILSNICRTATQKMEKNQVVMEKNLV